MEYSDKIREALKIVQILAQEQQRLKDTHTVDAQAIGSAIVATRESLTRLLGTAVAREEGL